MSNSKETCLWSYNGGCVVEENVITMAGKIKELFNLPSETDNIQLIKTIRLRLEEAPSTDENRNEATRLVTDLLKFSSSGCNNCAFKEAAENSAKYR
jgi:hypothetical protein